jgi:antitoxin component YwqK of YwqJK toxin-antitoxin module
MKTKLTFLLALTFLFLFSGSVYGKSEPTKDRYRENPSETEKIITKKCSSDLNISKCEFQLRIVKSFVGNLRDRDIDGVVGQVSFPFAFWDEGKEIAVLDNPEQFRKYYDHIFPDHVVKKIVRYPLGRQWSNWQGIALPGGELWFHKNTGKLKTINAYDEKLIKKMADDIRRTNNPKGHLTVKEQVKKKYWDNGKLKIETHYKNGKQEGLETWWYKSGEKKQEMHWKNGKKDELRKSWYKSGKKKSVGKFKNGNSEGLDTSWYESGRKSDEHHWENGELHGVTTFWFKSGEKSSETHFKNGLPEGLSTTWYESGGKMSESHWKDGTEDGIRKEWDKDGKLTFQGMIVDGVEKTN